MLWGIALSFFLAVQTRRVGSTCTWNPAKGSAAADNKTACTVLGPGVSLTTSITDTHVRANNVTHVDIQTVIYRTEGPSVDPNKSRISVAAIPYGGCNGCDFYDHTGSSNCSEQFELIKLAGSKGADVAVLPEEFLWNPETPPPPDCDMSPKQNCSIINFLGAIAKQYSMYIVFGMRASAPPGDPYPVDPARGPNKLGYNTDVILGRDGQMVGYYRKSWPCCPSPDGQTMDDGYPSREMVKTFDLDFGRVGLQTCFDMNFMDTWHQLYAQYTDIVFWPSAYGGGMPIRAYPKLFHYAIVPAGWGDITDMHGNVAPGLRQEAEGIFTAVLDLDTTYFHTNFNNFDRILADHKGDIVRETIPGYCGTPGNCSSTGDILDESGFVVLSRTDAGYAKNVSVRALKDKYGLMDLRTYQHQSRRAINMQRMTAAPGVSDWKYNRDGTSGHWKSN